MIWNLLIGHYPEMNQTKLHILNLEPEGYSHEAKKILSTLGRVDEGPLTREVLIKEIAQYDVVIVRLAHQINEEILKQAKKLKVIVSATTGLNHINIDFAEKQGITVLSLKGEIDFLNEIYATAEHTWALLLSLIRKLPQAHTHVLHGAWNRDLFKGSELHGKTLGIIGLGRLGAKVARYGQAFGMRVIATDIAIPKVIPEGVVLVSLHELLADSDVISLHANYSQSNCKMIGPSEISHMKPGSIFINTARGELVDETALLEALKNKHLSAAALDVLVGENDNWNSSNELLNYAKANSNLLITPHTGGATAESMNKTEIFMANKLLRVLNE